MTDQVDSTNSDVENNDAQGAENTAQESAQAADVPLNSFIGKKVGMTRVFSDDGLDIPVTVIELIPNVVTQAKSQEKEGYTAYQIGYGEKREKLLKKPIAKRLEKSGVKEKLSRYYEVRTDSTDASNVGKRVNYSSFEANSFVDVTSTSKGKGFQGVMKKYGFSGGPATHGSHFHRTPGSIGNRATPGKVFKLKKMPGQMGGKKVTTQNLKVVEVNTDKGYMLVKGAVPGAKNAFVRVTKALKK